MKRTRLCGLAAFLLASTVLASGATAAGGPPAVGTTYKHVLLISVDGMHAVDLRNWIAANKSSNFAKLAAQGVQYPAAYTTGPSDSFPGMIAQVTGATPKTGDLFYDDSYTRTGFPAASFYTDQKPPAPDLGCTTPPGAELTNFEAIDNDFDHLTGLVKTYFAGGTLGQPKTQIDTKRLQRRLDKAGNCVTVYPHEYLGTNTIFEIIKAANAKAVTAWSDKHPAYEVLNGPSGKGIDDLFTPEINSHDTLNAGAGPMDDYTKSFIGVRTYDGLKVQAVLNWIDGYDSTKQTHPGVPAVFGMNFQSVSVGQKLAKQGDADTAAGYSGLIGGYTDAQGTPGQALSLQFQFVDASLGQFMAELKSQGIADSTLIIVSAKHGQSPIDIKQRQTVDDGAYSGAPGFGPGANAAQGFEICDDEALVWLSPQLQQATDPATGKLYYDEARAYILANAASLKIQQLMDRTQLKTVYQDPFAPGSRTPDFIALTYHGVICTGGSKLAEHGGFSNDDRNVVLLLSAPALKATTAGDRVFTTQIAPTILHALGLDPSQLQAVKSEGTDILRVTVSE